MLEAQEKLERVVRLLREETTLALATIGEDGSATVAPLFYLAGPDLALYWLSSAASAHSRNLARTPRTAVTIYCHAESWRQIRGVQMAGVTCVVADPERRRSIVKAYCERFKLGKVFTLAIRRSILYAFDPESIRFIDNGNGFGDKVELARPPEGWSVPLPTALVRKK